jgi:hypothetical protein
MAGRRRAGARHVPRHARPSSVRAVALIGAAGIAALSGALLLSYAPAGAEASSTTATLTLTGVRDSNCEFSTGGTTVYVKPGGDATFKGELAGLKVTVPLLGQLDLSSSKIASFDDKLVIDGHTKTPHYVGGKKTYTMHDVSAGKHKIAWSADSITLVGGLKVPLSAKNTTLPAGGHLDWVGTLAASKTTKCGISIEVPGGGVSVGPITLSVPPITSIPTISVPHLPSVPNLPGGSSSSSPAHHPGHGGGTTSSAPPQGGGGTQSQRPTTIPELVVPNAGSGGDSAFGGGGGLGGVGALPDTGGSIGPIAPAAVTSTAPAPAQPSSSKAKPIDLATNKADDGMGGPQLPVLLAIVAIIALSLVTATYARMYLLRKPPGTPAA